MFVLASDGTPLDPCHPARARKLLKSGRAVVARHGLYSIQLDHRGGKIRDKLTARAAHRRGRRSRNLRFRAPRFANRRRPDGWLAPSLRHRVDTAMNWVARLRRLAPVRAIHVETVRFDTHALAAGRPLAGVEYQHGTLHGYEAREYLLEKWGRACAYCAAGGIPLTIDHIHPRSRGGSDRISNLCLACVPCNQAKNSTPVTEFLAGRPAVLARVLARAKAPLRDAAAVNATRWALFRALTATGLPVRCGSGGRTKWNRHRTGAPKSTGRVAVRTSGSHTVQTTGGPVKTSYKHLRLLQRADGYTYTIKKEEHRCAP
ncbi:RNA-guided endonuclease IscB [Nonomuraea sp. NPDC049480]|uniref:RNA-guided endonuclease IscB n=1 Tax=Nonomuraea sp. NPDC049480 TaxID=3364353 RepID=UPI0037A6C29F